MVQSDYRVCAWYAIQEVVDETQSWGGHARSQLEKRQHSSEWFREINSRYHPIQMVLGELSVSFSRYPSPAIEIEIKRGSLSRHSDCLGIYLGFHKLRNSGSHISGPLLLFSSLANLRTPGLPLSSVRPRSQTRSPRIRTGPWITHAAVGLIVVLVYSQNLYRVAKSAEGSKFRV